MEPCEAAGDGLDVTRLKLSRIEQPIEGSSLAGPLAARAHPHVTSWASPSHAIYRLNGDIEADVGYCIVEGSRTGDIAVGTFKDECELLGLDPATRRDLERLAKDDPLLRRELKRLGALKRLEESPC